MVESVDLQTGYCAVRGFESYFEQYFLVVIFACSVFCNQAEHLSELIVNRERKIISKMAAT